MKNKESILSLVLVLILLFSLSMAASAAQITGNEEIKIADISTVQGETPSMPEAQDGAEYEAQTVPAPQKSNNTLFFVGAGIAVLMFAGVALYCNKNGNRTF